ncbi:MAG: site-specific DNA-methyltransferase [Alphaproteobacteria bacterium]
MLRFEASAVERWPMERLLPYAANARQHSERQITLLAEAIVRYGFTTPCLVDGDGLLIAGHGRLLAARKLELTHVPVIRMEHLSSEEIRALRISDNRLGELSSWDNELLSEELHALNAVGFDLPSLGFDDGELDRLLAPLDDGDGSDDGAEDTGPDADDAPEPPCDPVTRLGDLWYLGDHRLLCGDSADAAAVALVMNGGRAALCFTSPPYSNQRAYTTGGIEDWDGLMSGVFRHLPEIMRDDGQVLVNLGLIHRSSEVTLYWNDWCQWMRRQGWRFFGWYVWDKLEALPGDWNGRLAPSFEFLFHFNRAVRRPNKIVECRWGGQDTHLRPDGHSTALRKPDGSVGSWTHVGRPTQEFRIPDATLRIRAHKARGLECKHPAIFPTALADFIMRSYSDEGDACFEPFSGSGTSIVAAQQCGRRCHAIELAPEYVDIAALRFRQLFPDVPVTLNDGRTFEQVAVERKAG